MPGLCLIGRFVCDRLVYAGLFLFIAIPVILILVLKPETAYAACPTPISTPESFSCTLGAGESVEVTASGSVSKTDFFIIGVADAAGSIVNAGTISSFNDFIDPSTILLFDNTSLSGGITNSGTITANGAAVEVDATAINVGAGTITGGINNSGTIAGGSAGDLTGVLAEIGRGIRTLNLADVDTIVNTGTIAGSGSSAGYGIHIDQSFGTGGTVSGDIDNTGTIIGNGLSGTGIKVDLFSTMGGDIINNNSASISGTGTETGRGIEILFGTMDGDIVNNGTISGTGAVTPLGFELSSGIYIEDSTMAGGIINSGTITGTHYGIHVSSDLPGGISNNAGGVISGSDAGIFLTRDMTITNQAGGSISSITMAGPRTLSLGGLGDTGTITGGGINSHLNIVDDFSTGGSITEFNTLNVNDSVTMGVNHDITQGINNMTLNVGEGTSGLLQHAAGTITVNDLIINTGGTFTQSGSGVLNTGTVRLGEGATLTLANQGTISSGSDGLAPGQGHVVIAGDYTLDTGLGGFFGNSLAAVTVNDGATLTSNHSDDFVNNDIFATAVTVGEGLSGTLLQVGGTLESDTLTINAGGTFIQSGTGVLKVGEVTVGDGASLTLTNSHITRSTPFFQSFNQEVGPINGAAAGQGDLVFSVSADLGVLEPLFVSGATLGGTNSLASIQVNDGMTLRLGHNANVMAVIVGEGTSGVLEQTAGTLTADTLTINAGGVFNQDVVFNATDGILNVTNTLLGDGATLTLVNQGSGAIDGQAAGQGILVFAGNYDTDAPIGAGDALMLVRINENRTLSLDQDLAADEVTLGEPGFSEVDAFDSVVNQSAGTLTTSSLTIGHGGGLFTQSGTGVLQADNIFVGFFSTLTLINQGTGSIDGLNSNIVGNLVFAGDYDTDSAIGATNPLQFITVNDGVTLSLDQDLKGGFNDVSITNLTVGRGSGGSINQSAGTVSEVNLTLNAGAAFTQSGTGVLNANFISIHEGATLTLVNQGSGRISSSTTSRGNLVFAGDYNTDAQISNLATIIVNDGATLSLDQNTSALTVTVGQGASGTVNQSAGTLTADTLAINAGGAYAFSGGALNVTNITLGSNATLSLANQIDSLINGAAAGQGVLAFTGDFNTSSIIGGTNSLDKIIVDGSASLFLDEPAFANTINIGNDAALDLAIPVATAINGVSAGAGTLNIVTSFNSASSIGSGNALGTVLINDGVTLGLGHDLATTLLSVNGILSHQAGAISAQTLRVNNGGTYKISTSQPVTGDFNLLAGGTFATSINSATPDDAGKLTINGNANISADAIISLVVSPDAVLDEDITYTILQAAGGELNAPTTVLDDNELFLFTASVDGFNLILTTAFDNAARFLLNDFGAAIDDLSPNARALLDALIAMIDETDDKADLNNALRTVITITQLQDILNALVPETGTGAQSASITGSRTALLTVLNRLLAARTGFGGMTGLAAGDPFRESALWVQAFGTTGDQNTRGGVTGFDLDNRGITFGADALVSDKLRLGMAFSYFTTDVDTVGIANSTDIKSYQATLYSSLINLGWYLDSSLSYSWNDLDGRRDIVFGGLQRTALADYNSNQFSLQATVGRDMPMNRDFVVSPYLGLEYVNLSSDGYTEEGAGILNLTVDQDNVAALTSTLGVSVRRLSELNGGMTFMQEAHVGWRHDFLDETLLMSSDFNGGGTAFNTDGLDPADDSFNIGASLYLYSGSNSEFQFKYDYETRSGYDAHSGNLVFRYRF